MWETIQSIASSPNLTIILVFLCFIVIVFIIIVKSGFINVHTNAVSIGATDKERQVILQQCEWVKIHLEGLENTMSKPDRYNPWRGKYIVERVYDEYVLWITQNHVNTSDAYIEVRQDKIINLVNSLTDKPEFHTQEFREMLRNDTKYCIKKLVQIRESYKQ